MECPNCGSEDCVVTNDPKSHQILYDCPECGHEDHDNYEDVYGPMSVPWGFLL